MKTLLSLVVFLTYFASPLYGNSEPTVSIIIPCYVKHVYKLDDLLTCYAKQTEIPDQIVVSASSLTADTENYLEQLQTKSWPFELIILPSIEKQLASKNRNIACRHATKELFICQDADDFPHPQRVELIKHIYRKYHFDHLMHLCFHARHPITKRVVYNTMQNVMYHLNNLKVHFIKNYDQIYDGNYVFKRTVYPVNGAPAFPRRIFDDIQWKEDIDIGEDEDFNRTVYGKYDNKIILLHKLYYYCEWESTHRTTTPPSLPRKKSVL